MPTMHHPFLSMSMRCISVALLLLVGAVSVSAAELRYGVERLPVAPGGPYAARDMAANVLHSALFDGLTRLNANGDLEPALALSWEALTPTSWKFQLRRGVTFSNGEPFSAKSVAHSIEWLTAAQGAQTAAGRQIGHIERVETVGDHSVILHTNRPDAILPRRMSAVAMVPPQAWASLGPEAFSDAPIGTGPFTVGSLGETGHVRLRARPASWRPPKVDELVVISMPDGDARVRALLAGQIHMAGDLDMRHIEQVQTGGAFITAASAMAVAAIAFRQDQGRAAALKDRRVRQALNYAVDTARLNTEILGGLAEPAGQPAGRWTNGHNPDVRPYPFDPDRAKSLLFDAGIVAEFGLRFDVVVDRTPGDRELFRAVAEQLSAVGVAVEMRSIPYGRWLESRASGIWPADTDGFLLPFDSLPANDVQNAMEKYSCSGPAPFFCDKRLDAEIGEAGAEMDFAKRRARLDELARKFHDLAPALFLTEQFGLFAVSRDVRGFAVSGRVPVYEKISLSD